MCGIAGWFSNSESIIGNIDTIERMSETLCRRGPDEQGMYLDNNVCMLHRRLTVIDPETGKQPMSAALGDKKITLVYNGELYNTEDLRRELLSHGHSFNGHSDTEVLLKSYIQWGEKCVEKLNGIFAFTVYDSCSNSLFMARDPIGVKPFFYFKYDHYHFLPNC